MNDPATQPAATAAIPADVVAALRAGRDAKPRALWRRVPGFAVFLVRFARELVLANITMARIVLFQRVKELSPEFFHYDTTGLSSFEIVVLTHCITLTPGTTSVEVSEDETQVLVHGLDARDIAAVCLGIKNSLERPLLGWTR